MRKVIIFGSRGMIGHVVSSYLFQVQRYAIFGSVLHENQINSYYPVDVRNLNKVEVYIRKIKPDLIINCIGLLIKESESNIEDAIVINSLLPSFLSRLGHKLKYKLIHMSTDCVFSGKEGNYSEESTLDGNSIYARTKILGEYISSNDLVIRTSVVGPELKTDGSGLFNWFFQQKGEIVGFKNAFWTGVTTLELAKGIDEFIKQNISGIYHFAPKNKISKFDLLNLFKETWEKTDIQILPKEAYKNDKSLLNSRTDFNYPFKTYREMLLELRDWTQTNRSLYPEYY